MFLIVCFCLLRWFPVQDLYFSSSSSLNSLIKETLPKSPLQNSDSHRLQNLQSLGALVQLNNESKKRKNRIVFVISVTSGLSDSLCTAQLQCAVSWFSSASQHSNRWNPKISLVAIWSEIHFFLADHIKVYSSAGFQKRSCQSLLHCYHVLCMVEI